MTHSGDPVSIASYLKGNDSGWNYNAALPKFCHMSNQKQQRNGTKFAHKDDISIGKDHS